MEDVHKTCVAFSGTCGHIIFVFGVFSLVVAAAFALVECLVLVDLGAVFWRCAGIGDTIWEVCHTAATVSCTLQKVSFAVKRG